MPRYQLVSRWNMHATEKPADQTEQTSWAVTAEPCASSIGSTFGARKQNSQILSAYSIECCNALLIFYNALLLSRPVSWAEYAMSKWATPILKVLNKKVTESITSLREIIYEWKPLWVIEQCHLLSECIFLSRKNNFR